MLIDNGIIPGNVILLDEAMKLNQLIKLDDEISLKME